MRKIIVIVVLLAAGWYYMFGGQTLDQEAIDAFYTQDAHATLSRDPGGLCALLADNFEGKGVAVTQGQRAAETHDKAQACAAYDGFYQTIADLGNKMGGMLQLDYSHDIESVTFSSDRKTATVKVKYKMDIAGSVMNVRGETIDTLIRRHGKVFRLRSEDHSTITSG